MSEPPHNPCATCGACCRSYVVPVCGYDVWLISTRQHLGPEQFLFACPQQEPGPDGFRLGDGPTYGLALDKRGPLRATQPCVFLLQLAGGNARCGIYAERPVVCQGYPMSMWRDAVIQRRDALCPPGAWPVADIGLQPWRDALQRLLMRFDIYHEVVARWNARVAAGAPCASFTLLEYFSYLLNVYDRLAALDDEIGAPALATVQTEWRRLPEQATGSACATRSRDDVRWLRYFARARQIIDAFYSEIAPQPSQLRVLQPDDTTLMPGDSDPLSLSSDRRVAASGMGADESGQPR